MTPLQCFFYTKSNFFPAELKRLVFAQELFGLIVAGGEDFQRGSREVAAVVLVSLGLHALHEAGW